VLEIGGLVAGVVLSGFLVLAAGGALRRTDAAT
jgi:hypothetical protein